ncbi:interleukin-6 receptor subunit beta isoform X2 [Protopterus annectens]|nr:interleukin-6 receptor subunit beta isoform X2 [Protopterus annectens]XP_043919717.1 interleukin-6 receptor subunit beta isoform X2 [Protopterus annectens]XP_043919718.1 interleukin-6 receptor subunit beta isoform X2 [Protopterus annectens]
MRMLLGWICIILPCIHFNPCVVAGFSVEQCGRIIPDSSVIKLGSTFTAFCILNETCLSQSNIHINASDIIWKSKKNQVSKDQYTVINRTVSSVTFNDTTSLKSPLTCNSQVYGRNAAIDGIVITLGLPPEEPKNLTCFVHQLQNMTCTWDPGRETFLPTNYTVKLQRFSVDFPDCKAKVVNNSCTTSQFPMFLEVIMWVEATNVLGTSQSEHIIQDLTNIVKPNAPVIRAITSVLQLPNALKIEWSNPFQTTEMSLKYNIRYRPDNTKDWIKVPPEETASHRDSFTLQDLRSHTVYIVSIRCMKMDGKGYWSDWSEEVSGLTPETKPTKKVDIWRFIESSESHNSRLVHLMWKKLDPSYANGEIVEYEVHITLKDRHPAKPFNVSSTSLNCTLTLEAYIVTVIAYNSAGKSPPATLMIPASTQKDLPPVQSLKAFPKNGQLWVEWKASHLLVNAYILEWCVESEREPCITSWQQEESTTGSVALRGKDIKPFKRYVISIYPIYSGGPGAAQTTRAYLQQDRPAQGPVVKAKKIGKSEAVLVWNQIPLDYQNGFIKNFTIVYRTEERSEHHIIVDSTYREYTLSSLTRNTLYIVHMAASTEKGSKSGPAITFTTLKFAKGEIEAIVIPVCLAFLLSSVLGMLFCLNRCKVIKKHVWPNVPDPSNSTIARWSPQSPTRYFNPKDQLHPEGNITDVSVIEVEADAKSSFLEHDMKTSESLQKEKSSSLAHSSGIGGSSCMSSPGHSGSDSEEGGSGQTTSSTIQYSTVIVGGYRGQMPSVHTFSRSESTQPLLDSEERSEDLHLHLHDDLDGTDQGTEERQYFKQNYGKDESCSDGPHCLRPGTFTQSLKSDHLKLEQLQINEPSSDSSAFTAAVQGTLHELSNTDNEEQTIRLELLGFNSNDSEEPNSYLPQNVNQGGYMPQ